MRCVDESSHIHICRALPQNHVNSWTRQSLLLHMHHMMETEIGASVSAGTWQAADGCQDTPAVCKQLDANDSLQIQISKGLKCSVHLVEALLFKQICVVVCSRSVDARILQERCNVTLPDCAHSTSTRCPIWF